MGRPPPPLEDPLGKQLAALGELLRSRRKALGLSAVVVSESAGLSRPTVHRIERGEPSVAMGAYLLVANVLGLAFTLHTSPKAASSTTAGDTGAVIPVRISLDQYPALAQLAWQLDQAGELTPREALNIYERNWRHVDEASLSSRERSLVENLRLAFSGEPNV